MWPRVKAQKNATARNEQLPDHQMVQPKQRHREKAVNSECYHQGTGHVTAMPHSARRAPDPVDFHVRERDETT
ncbi:hypothetical protein AAFF_G00285770 [Aldrovandia affinis]|uniref:Uncharacterized protein n=1 Tax=Aldrovandia affinis TaxID=143900 RepID=A0AAD7TAH9_9TELE|nr:hypothetical protein AAFF_G00285770 [Aldrovandia affinis]